MTKLFACLIVLSSMLWSLGSVQAQQVCYSYDGLGRLTGVIDQNNQAAFYDYDAVGNILAIRRQSPTGPVTIYSFDPPGALSGSRLEIFGTGFSATANQNQVSIAGVPATVVSTLPCVLVVELPANVASGPITVNTPLGTATSSQNFTAFSIAIPLTNPAILRGGTQVFSATVSGCPDASVVWSVNGFAGGNSLFGTIDAAGLYTAPASIPVPATVTIRAESASCGGLFAETTLTIVSEFTGFVFASASASFGLPAPLFPSNTVLHSASVAYGSAPSEAAQGSIISSASFANAPVITAISPNSAARGANFNVMITGVNLTGATDLRFLGASTPDAAITVTNVAANGAGTTLTANISILSTAATGARTVRVDNPMGNSTAGNTGVNIFTITP